MKAPIASETLPRLPRSHDVFLSYSKADKAVADAAFHFLEDAGVRCWVAPRDVPPGANWAAAIVTAIEESRAMVLILSAGANASPQVVREVERAVNRGLPLVTVRIDDVVPSKELEYFISSQHWLDALTPPLEEHLRHLCSSVKALIDAPPVPSKAVATPRPQRLSSRGRGPWVLPTVIVALLLVILGTMIWGMLRSGNARDSRDSRGTVKHDTDMEMAVAVLLEESRTIDERIHRLSGLLGKSALEAAFALPAGTSIGDSADRAFSSGAAKDLASGVRMILVEVRVAALSPAQMNALVAIGVDATALTRLEAQLREFDSQGEKLIETIQALEKETSGSALAPADSIVLGLYRIQSFLLGNELAAGRAYREILVALTSLSEVAPARRSAIERDLARLRELEPRRLLDPELLHELDGRLSGLDRTLAERLTQIMPSHEAAGSAELHRLRVLLKELDDLELRPTDEEVDYVLKAVVARELNLSARSAEIYRAYGARFGKSIETATEYARVAEIYTLDPQTLGQPQALYVYQVNDDSALKGIIQVGDVIERWGDERLLGQDDAIDYRSRHAGEQVELHVFRVTSENPRGSRLVLPVRVPRDRWAVGLQQI